MPRPARTGNVAVISRRLSRNLGGVARDLAALVRSLHAAASRASSSTGLKAAARAGRRRRALTPRDRARLKLQGEYLGLVRHLPKRHRRRVMALRAEKGYPPAIRLARSLMKKA